MGWWDQRVIRYNIERLHKLKNDRSVRPSPGRTKTFYGDAVMNDDKFTTLLAAWPAEKDEDIYHRLRLHASTFFWQKV